MRGRSTAEGHRRIGPVDLTGRATGGGTLVPMTAAHKWVYLFREGSAEMRDLLGGKGAGAAEMTRAGMPVPPGFTITTEACRAYYAHKGKLPDGLWDQVTGALAQVEKQSGRRFGDNLRRSRLGRSLRSRLGDRLRGALGQRLAGRRRGLRLGGGL